MHIGRELSLAGRVFESTHNFTLLEMAYDGQLVQSRSGIFSIVPLRWASELPDILIKSNISHCRDERHVSFAWPFEYLRFDKRHTANGELIFEVFEERCDGRKYDEWSRGEAVRK